MAIDTLQLSKDLQDVEFTRDQADALAQIFLRYSNEELEGKLRKEFARLEQRMDALQSSLEALQSSQEALQRGLEALRADIKVWILDLRAEIKAGDASNKVEIIKWIVGALVLNLAGTAGLIITLVKIIPH